LKNKLEKIAIIVLISINICCHFLCVSAGEIDFLAKVNVIPTPKKLVLQRKGILLSSAGRSNAIIIISEKNLRRLEEAAKSINSRIVNMGGKALPVFKDTEFTVDMGQGKNLILLGNKNSNIVTKKYWIHQGRNIVASMPDAQGYIIETLLHRSPGGGSVIILAGTDSLGTYYAASTFRELIQKKGDNIIAVAASARDWPDCKYRPIWGRNARDRKDMEYWSLFKSTGIFAGFHPLRLLEKKPPFNISESTEKGELKKFEYGEAIGFKHEALINTDLADKRFPFTYSSKPYKDILKEWDGVVNQNHLYSWSHEKELRIRFDAVSRALKAGKFGLVWLHTPDTDPSNYWSKRSKSCKEKWGDDFASWSKAQVWLIKLIMEEIRKHNPDLKIIFCMRPYTSNTIDEVDWRWESVVKAALKEIPFDKNSYILVREDAPERTRLWRKKWKGMKQYYYIEVLPARPSPLYATMGRLLSSFMDGSKEDIIWPNSYRAYPDPVNVLMTLERRWNKGANGPGLWPKNRFDFIRDNLKPASPTEEDLLLRVCRAIYGYEAGSVLTEVYRHGLIPDLAANPENYRNIYNISDIKNYLDANLQASEKAFTAVDKILQGKIPLSIDGKRFFPLIYRVALTTLALTEAQIATINAKELIGAGKDKEAATIIKTAEKRLKERITTLNESDVSFKSWPAAFDMKYDGHRTWKELAIETPKMRGAHKDCSAGARIESNLAALRNLMNNKKIIFAESEMIKKSANLSKTPLPVIIARKWGNQPKTKDFPDQETWEKAKWEQGFVLTKRLLYSRYQTKVAVLYDDKNIYFSFNCPIAAKALPVAKNTESDKWSVEDEYVELMISPNIKKGFFQLFANSAGVIGDLIWKMPGSKGGLYKNQSAAEAETEGFEAAHPKPQSDYSWNSNAKTKIVTGTKSWNIQIAIPLSAFQIGPFRNVAIKEGDKWKVNFCRSIPKTNLFSAEYSSMSRAEYAAYWTYLTIKFE
jgi:hypothetical protein